jgi:Transposase IS116/IS110/IS902 family
VVEALQALRGVQFTVAVTLVAELGDLTRFDHPRELMKFLARLLPFCPVEGCQKNRACLIAAPAS